MSGSDPETVVRASDVSARRLFVYWHSSLLVVGSASLVLWQVSLGRLECDLRGLLAVSAGYLIFSACVRAYESRCMPSHSLGAALCVHIATLAALFVLWGLAGFLSAAYLLPVLVLTSLTSAAFGARSVIFGTAIATTGFVAYNCALRLPEIRPYLGWLGHARQVMPVLHAGRPWLAGEEGDALLGTLLVFILATVSALLGTDRFVVTTRRLQYRALAARRVLERTEGPFRAVLQASPTPAVVVHAESGSILYASESLSVLMSDAPECGVGGDVVEVFQFDRSVEVRAALLSPTATVLRASCLVAREPREVEVRVLPVDFDGERYAYLSVESPGPAQCLYDSMDSAPDGLLIADDAGLVTYANVAALSMLPGLQIGASVVPVFESAGLPPDPRRHREREYDLLSGDSTRSVYVNRMRCRISAGRDGTLIRLRLASAEEKRSFGSESSRRFTNAVSVATNGAESGSSVGMITLPVLRDVQRDDDALLVSALELCLHPGDESASMGPGQFAVFLLGRDAQTAERMLQSIVSGVYGGHAHRRLVSPPSIGTTEVRDDDDVHTVMWRVRENSHPIEVIPGRAA